MAGLMQHAPRTMLTFAVMSASIRKSSISATYIAFLAMETISELTHTTSDVNDGTYQYDTLPPGESFRYLILQPGSGDEPLKCSLQTTLLAGTEFEAISYVWGTTVRDHTIWCDERTLKITPNLFAALHRLRDPVTPRRLWADSICINQHDAKEKGHQVGFMAQIYKRAERVLLYVGPDSGEDGPNVTSLLGDMRRFIDDQLSKINTSEWNAFPYPKPNDPILADPRWKSINRLIEQDWFSRGWVVREAALAQSGLMIWDQEDFSWDDLMWTMTWANTRLSRGLSIVDPHAGPCGDRNIDRFRVLLTESQGLPTHLLEYMSSRTLQFTIPHDRLYAFLDFAARPLSRLHLEPDYTLTALDAFQNFAIQYLHTTGDINLLGFVVHDEQSLQSGPPSWVSRWDLISSQYMPHYMDYSAETLLSRDTRAFGPLVTEKAILKVRGVVFDTVKFVSDVSQESATTPALVSDLLNLVRSCCSSSPYAGPHLLGAFLNTLVRTSYRGDWRAWQSAATAYLKEIEKHADGTGIFECSKNEEHREEWHVVHAWLTKNTHAMRFIITERGYMGLAPAVARGGDSCSIVFGCKRPALIRPLGQASPYRFLGPTFIQGSRFSEIDGFWGFWDCFGDEDSKEWVDWDVEEQDIYLS